MVRVSSPAKLRPWSELTAEMVMGVVPALVNLLGADNWRNSAWVPKQSGSKMSILQHSENFCHLETHRFDTPLGAVTETPKTGTKTNGYQNA